MKTKADKKNNRRGRKSAWLTIIQPQLERIPKLRREGLTEKQIADMLGIGYETLRENKHQHPELSEALKEGKRELIENLEASLYKIALGGYEIKDKTTKKYIEQQADGSQKTKIEETENVKTAQPQIAALCFTLKNLDHDHWKDVFIEGNFDDMQKVLDNFKSFSEEQQKIKTENLPEDDPTK